MSKKGVLLVNLGTPDSPSTADVRKYLREFLMDERVIDINSISRTLLVKGIIAPTRGPKSAKLYRFAAFALQQITAAAITAAFGR
jgi:ferrochelatase